MQNTKTDEILGHMAGVIAGLQVPVSIGMALGDTPSEWRALWAALGLFGWHDKESIKAKLREALIIDHSTEGV